MADLQHWIEVLGAALIALGGWLWGIGRRYQGLRDEIRHLGQEDARLSQNMARIEGKIDSETATLRQEIMAVERARSESSAKIYTRLDEISRDQAAQGAQITYILETCNRTQNSLDSLLAGRV